MKGTVYALDGGLVFAKTEEGGICWFEQLCGEMETGDVVSGDLCTEGRQQLRNETRDRTVSVLLGGTEYKRIGMAFGIPGLLLFGGSILTSHLVPKALPSWISIPLLAIWLVGVVLLVIGLCYYAKAKGYLAVWGFLLPDYRHRSVGSGLASRPD